MAPAEIVLWGSPPGADVFAVGQERNPLREEVACAGRPLGTHHGRGHRGIARFWRGGAHTLAGAGGLRAHLTASGNRREALTPTGAIAPRSAPLL